MATAANIRHLRCFIAVAAEGSFTAAAGRLAVTQSALTASIQQLEEELGLKLFHRTTRRVEPTAAGSEFLPVAQRLLRDFDGAFDDMRAAASGERGHIGIATAPSAMGHLLAPAIDAFCARYPHVRLTIREAVSAEVLSRVLSGAAELGFTSRWSDAPELCTQALRTDELGVICQHGHPLATLPGPVTWAALRGHRYIAHTIDTSTRAQLQAVPGVAEMLRDPQHEVSTINMLYWMLRGGHGISVIPSLVADLPLVRDFCFRRLEEPVIEREICLVTRRGRELSAAARRLVELL